MIKKHLAFIQEWIGHDDILELLLDKGSDPNTSDNLGVYAIHIAVYYSQLPIIRELLKKGADVNPTITYGEFKGYTPLHFAANTEIADLLRNAGAKA